MVDDRRARGRGDVTRDGWESRGDGVHAVAVSGHDDLAETAGAPLSLVVDGGGAVRGCGVWCVE